MYFIHYHTTSLRKISLTYKLYYVLYKKILIIKIKCKNVYISYKQRFLYHRNDSMLDQKFKSLHFDKRHLTFLHWFFFLVGLPMYIKSIFTAI